MQRKEKYLQNIKRVKNDTVLLNGVAKIKMVAPQMIPWAFADVHQHLHTAGIAARPLLSSLFMAMKIVFYEVITRKLSTKCVVFQTSLFDSGLCTQPQTRRYMQISVNDLKKPITTHHYLEFFPIKYLRLMFMGKNVFSNINVKRTCIGIKFFHF